MKTGVGRQGAGVRSKLTADAGHQVYSIRRNDLIIACGGKKAKLVSAVLSILENINCSKMDRTYNNSECQNGS